MIKPTMTINMCIAAQILLLESEQLLLLHMPRTATFVPRTAHFVAEARLFSFHVVFACTVGEPLWRRVSLDNEEVAFLRGAMAILTGRFSFERGNFVYFVANIK